MTTSLPLILASVLLAAPALAKQEATQKAHPAAAEPQGLTEQQFNEVIDTLEMRYKEKRIFKNLGVTFTVERRWTDNTKNSNMSKRGKRWFINSYGGLARHETMTPDAFSLVLCGQVGTLLGGFPYWRPEQKKTRVQAMSMTANANYYATYVCADLLWGHDHEQNAKSREVVDHESKPFCDSVFKDEAKQNLCYRKAMAARIIGDFFNRDKPVSIETPDEKIVEKTTSSGGGQCHFDTFLAGAACKKAGDWQHDKYPMDEHQMAAQSCAAKEADYPYDSADVIKAGLRPFCWFKPGL